MEQDGIRLGKKSFLEEAEEAAACRARVHTELEPDAEGTGARTCAGVRGLVQPDAAPSRARPELSTVGIFVAHFAG